jgi:hypothetical protein
MGIQLSNYSFRALPVPTAYLRVEAIELSRGETEAANVSGVIYANKAARDSGVTPLAGVSFAIVDDASADAGSPAATAFSSTFGTVPPTGKTVQDAMVTAAYQAIQKINDPSAKALLAGSVEL